MFGDALSSSMMKRGEQNFLTVLSACEKFISLQARKTLDLASVHLQLSRIYKMSYSQLSSLSILSENTMNC